MTKMRDWYYRFMCALAWICGWPILLFLKAREHLRKEAEGAPKLKECYREVNPESVDDEGNIV